MAFDTFANLKASIANWLMRDDLTGAIPDFISLAEARIAANLRVAQMETVATATLANGAVQLPDDWIEARQINGIGSYDRPLAEVSPGYAGSMYSGVSAGNPRSYTIVGNTLTTYPSGGTATVTMTYYAKPPALSDAQPTNWLLMKWPNLYLYGALMESAPFLVDDGRFQVWGSMFQQALADAQSADERARYGNAAVRVAGVTP